MNESTSVERDDRSSANSPVTDAQTSSGAALFWIGLMILSFAITLFLIFRAAL